MFRNNPHVYKDVLTSFVTTWKIDVLIENLMCERKGEEVNYFTLAVISKWIYSNP
jgi:hypothetical protein